MLHIAYHAALCHDAGKLFVIDTVFVYWRRLLDMEFDLIKTGREQNYQDTYLLLRNIHDHTN